MRIACNFLFCCVCFRKKKEFDWQAYVQRRIKRLAREIQVDMHKVRNCIITCKSPALLYVYGYSRQRIFLPVGSFALPGPQIPHAYNQAKQSEDIFPI